MLVVIMIGQGYGNGGGGQVFFKQEQRQTSARGWLQYQLSGRCCFNRCNHLLYNGFIHSGALRIVTIGTGNHFDDLCILFSFVVRGFMINYVVALRFDVFDYFLLLFLPVVPNTSLRSITAVANVGIWLEASLPVLPLCMPLMFKDG